MASKVYSFSSVDAFEFCAKRYYHERVAKDVERVQTPEAAWGEMVHKAFEIAITESLPMPQELLQYQPLVDAVGRQKAAGWHVACEQSFVIRNNGSAEMTDAEDIWYNPRNLLAGSIDLLMVSPDGKSAIINDWKTNKTSKYAKPEQMELYALATLLAYPDVERVDCCLMFIVDNFSLVKSSFVRDNIANLLEKWKRKTQTIMLATINNNFPAAKPSPLCGWCPVTSCDNYEQGAEFRERKERRARR